MALRVAGVEIFERLRHPDVQPLPSRMQQLVVHDLANPLVGEVELFAEAVQHAAAHQLFDALGGVPFVEPRRALEEREIEFAPDDGRHRREMSAAVAQALQAAGHDAANALGQRQGRRRARSRAFLDRPDGLHDQEGVARARAPDLGVELGVDAVSGRTDE